jgi:hypothetical protein
MKAVQAMSVFHRGERPERPERPIPYSLHEGVMGAAGAAGAQEWGRDSASEEAGEKFTELVAQVAQVALLPLSQRFLEIGRSPIFRGGRSGRSLAPARARGRGRSLDARSYAQHARRGTRKNEAKEFTTAYAGSWNNPGATAGRARARHMDTVVPKIRSRK